MVFGWLILWARTLGAISEANAELWITQQFEAILANGAEGCVRRLGAGIEGVAA